ncbi:ABC transporter ATP-binding protein [Paracoccus liaowanqingii]|uniref:ABC transporter ATP-binding protein n=1 Tax=Paracoccus liaowanqingii TaxID=2560053 RepID=A0A4Z1CQY0_9RHOB|nr:ABC transporter ATP-binding protein [Paracoccus liaowanqingii]QDA36484.1 ABC transporter ATP-binding protein [Paracoccus liaowanqingii]TGN67560.1 ABC transporter ATP-binding protein [Paracoccus liaowanqingii]
MIALHDVAFAYPQGGFRIHVPHLDIAAGARVAIVGPSGTGKTTVLNLIAGLVVPLGGSVMVDGTDMAALPDAARRRFRLTRIGFVFQNFALIEYLTVLDNILIAARIHPDLPLTPNLRARARDLADAVGMGDKIDRHPGGLSMGEQQRVAIARALLARPAILLADEATGNLDPDTKGRILDLLFDQAARSGTTVLAVTHDHDLLPRFDRTIDFRDLQAAP